MIIEKPNKPPKNPTMQDIHPNVSSLRGKKLSMIKTFRD